jgi:hypothetical protein
MSHFLKVGGHISLALSVDSAAHLRVRLECLVSAVGLGRDSHQINYTIDRTYEPLRVASKLINLKPLGISLSFTFFCLADVCYVLNVSVQLMVILLQVRNSHSPFAQQTKEVLQ